MTDATSPKDSGAVEHAVLDAALVCIHRFGFSKVTIDDICQESGVSRASVYRLFPGGRDVLFEALHVRELHQFFEQLLSEIDGLDTVEDIVAHSVAAATLLLRTHSHLAMMLSSEPGEALGQLTATGLPRIIRMATVALSPQLDPLIGRESAHRLIDLAARLTVSYFLSPDEVVDLSDPDIAGQFLRPIITAVAVPESFSGMAATLNRSTS